MTTPFLPPGKGSANSLARVRSGIELTGVRVAFFRNMNLGQRRSNSPTSAQFLDAFAQAGAPGARVFQTNGTVIFEAPGGNGQAREAARLLHLECGYADLVVVRSARWIVDLAARLDTSLPGCCVTLFDGREDPGLPLPWTHPATGLKFLELDRRHAVTLWPPDSPSGGSPANRVIAGLMGVPGTGRTAGTIVRLANRL